MAAPKFDDENITDTFLRLLRDQLLVRVSVSRSEMKTPHEHCRIDLVSFSPDLGSTVASAFVHLVWYCGYEEKKGDMHGSRLELYNFVIEENILDDEALKRARPHLQQALGNWTGGVTGDGPRSYTQWMDTKPFVGVASVGIRPNSHIVPLEQSSRPLLVYYGYLLGKLDAYVAQLNVLRPEFTSDMEGRCVMMEQLLYRWRTFVHQTQLKQLNAVYL